MHGKTYLMRRCTDKFILNMNTDQNASENECAKEIKCNRKAIYFNTNNRNSTQSLRNNEVRKWFLKIYSTRIPLYDIVRFHCCQNNNSNFRPAGDRKRFSRSPF